MYKPIEPIRCPKCGTIVKVDLFKILTPNPKCYEWTCPNCGEKGNTKHGDVITFENQIGRATSGYIRKVDEPDLGVGITTTNATGDGYNTINAVPSICSPMTECEICGEEFKFDSRSYICPKCREAIVKLRKTTDSTANAMPIDKSTVTDPKSTACDIPGKPILQQGWECPKCGAILAPHQTHCPFCSPSGYGRSNWVVTTPAVVPLMQYTNPNPSTAISLGDKLKTQNSDNITYATPCGNIKETQ